MRTRCALLSVCAGVLMTTAALGAELTVTVTGLRSDTGRVLMCLFAERESIVAEFPDCDTGKPVRNDKLSISGGAATVTYKGLTEGTYAIALIHDENMDNKLDTNFIGIPTEGIGVSNNPLLLGAPSFSQARFQVAGNATLSVEAKYFLD